MTILRIEELTYGVDKLDECIEFLERWGLEKESADASGAIFKTLENQVIQLRLIDDPSLPPTYEEGPTLREVMWGVDNQAALDEIEAELNKDREVTKDKTATCIAMTNAIIISAFKLRTSCMRRSHRKI